MARPAAMVDVVVGAGQLPSRGQVAANGPLTARAHCRNRLCRLLHEITDRHVREGEIEPRHLDGRAGTIRLPADGLSYLVHGGRR